jgi:mono/diheme cytochrome c family protein/plastocyanin
MNTSKQINIMVLLVFASVIATAAYTIWDPHRASEATTRQTDKTVEYGAYLFSQNCITCHGNKAEGGAASNRLKLAPALNRPDLQGKDPKTGQVSKGDKQQAFKFVVNTITCGRIGKSMPTWGQSQGGTLNDQQIQQLATLISEGTGWDLVDELAVRGLEKYHLHGYDADGFVLAAPLDASSTTVILNKIEGLDKGGRLQIGDELMLINGKPSKDDSAIASRPAGSGIPVGGAVPVERGLGTTSPAAHDAGAKVLKPPVPPDPPAITQPACGQNLPPAVSTPSAPTAAATEMTVIGQSTLFDTDKLLGVAGKELTITFDNRDSGIPHNIHFFKGKDATGADVGTTDVAAGPVVQTLKIGPLDAGDYYYQCDVHPGTMSGTLTTVEGGAAAPAGATTPAAGTTPSATEAAAATPAATSTP